MGGGGRVNGERLGKVFLLTGPKRWVNSRYSAGKLPHAFKRKRSRRIGINLLLIREGSYRLWRIVTSLTVGKTCVIEKGGVKEPVCVEL